MLDVNAAWEHYRPLERFVGSFVLGSVQPVTRLFFASICFFVSTTVSLEGHVNNNVIK
jgi:hypothetical protein